jgi:hypothetical protein
VCRWLQQSRGNIEPVLSCGCSSISCLAFFQPRITGGRAGTGREQQGGGPALEDWRAPGGSSWGGDLHCSPWWLPLVA